MDPNNQPAQPQPPIQAASQPAANPGDRTITTPNGSKIVIKGYVSGGAMQELERVMAEGVVFELDVETGLPDPNKKSTMNGTAMIDHEKKALELLVVSFNGDAAGAVEKVRDLPVADFDVVVKAINELTRPLAKAPSTA